MDIFGEALSDYYYHRKRDILWLHNSYAEPEEMPIEVFFRKEAEMPELELLALEFCSGKIVDIGAGAGSHALLLQDQGKDVTALEVNNTACSIMRQRGVRKVSNADIFTFNEEKFDTLLLMMNGIGLCGNMEGLRNFLRQAGHWMNKDGRIIFDSSDISYLYDGRTVPSNRYFGEICYQYEYKGNKGPSFNWLYVDWHTMEKTAKDEGWSFRLLHEDGYDQYLASLQL